LETVERANGLAACSPREALNDPEIARLFAHYVDILAPWYDLNESSQVFGTTVTSHALHCPVLFKALIAFAATHWHKTFGESGDIAGAFHAACVGELLDSLEHLEPEDQGDYLAATCLLRSYEILNGIESQLV
jgi:Fungal specific transcription factor domain